MYLYMYNDNDNVYVYLYDMYTHMYVYAPLRLGQQDPMHLFPASGSVMPLCRKRISSIGKFSTMLVQTTGIKLIHCHPSGKPGSWGPQPSKSSELASDGVPTSETSSPWGPSPMTSLSSTWSCVKSSTWGKTRNILKQGSTKVQSHLHFRSDWP